MQIYENFPKIKQFFSFFYLFLLLDIALLSPFILPNSPLSRRNTTIPSSVFPAHSTFASSFEATPSGVYVGQGSEDSQQKFNLKKEGENTNGKIYGVYTSETGRASPRGGGPVIDSSTTVAEFFAGYPAL